MQIFSGITETVQRQGTHKMHSPVDLEADGWEDRCPESCFQSSAHLHAAVCRDVNLMSVIKCVPQAFSRHFIKIPAIFNQGLFLPQDDIIPLIMLTVTLKWQILGTRVCAVCGGHHSRA